MTQIIRASSSEIIKGKRQWNIIFKLLKKKPKTTSVNLEFYVQKKIAFRNAEIKAFSDERKLTAFIAKRPGLEEMLMEVSSRLNRNNTRGKVGIIGTEEEL